MRLLRGAGRTQRGSREGAVGDASTAGTSEASDEEHSERTAPSRLGLWRCMSLIDYLLFMNKRLRLWRCLLLINRLSFINKRLGLWRGSPPIH